ncbi:MAG: DNA methyltransferase [Pseudomonadota bacterium]|nr:DNA methyltransferase [Pseudomonadota bacterium]
MNAVEIEEAVSDLALQPFDAAEFPYQFLTAFGNKTATIKRLRSGSTNKSDLGGVLQTNNIHIAVAGPGDVTATLARLKDSPATTKAKAKYVLATDGETFEAEDLVNGETIACEYADFPDYFGFFLTLAGISTVRQIRENAFDIKATSRLNRLYVELLKDNPDWASDERREDMNHFMARLIFCFFAEDTNIFSGTDLFTSTVEKMSERDSSNTHTVISELFRAMNTKAADRGKENIARWANGFPYVNGGLFSGSLDVPRFSKIARSYLLHVGSLDWTKINPDIFGSMIQAVADDEERGELGMHYTSVPNILKVLDPLFLDDLREKLEDAGSNPRKLLNLRKRLARIRVFDPACGSGNFLVIAYKQMREIENQVNERRGEIGRKSEIPLTNFRGIELRGFSAEIARLALIIAEFQCDVQYLGQKEALQVFLPLETNNWITQGNALLLDWSSICPPLGVSVKHAADDLFATRLDQAEIHFENEGGESYICGNPPYLGSTWQSKDQKAEIKSLVRGRMGAPGFLDYVSGWFLKAADWIQQCQGSAAFVSTNSICQGQAVPLLWPMIFDSGCEIRFAHTSFRWANLAAKNAGVTVVIVGIALRSPEPKVLFYEEDNGVLAKRTATSISPYLVAGSEVIVQKAKRPLFGLTEMEFGNKPSDGGHLLLEKHEIADLNLTNEQAEKFLVKIYGSADFINGGERFCIWIEDSDLQQAERIPSIARRIECVRTVRLDSRDKGANALAKRSHQLKLMRRGQSHTIIVPSVSSERRPYLPAGLLDNESALTNLAFGIYDGPIWNLAILLSRMHLVWISTVCGKMKTDFRYSNTLGWNTFPLPSLTRKNKTDLTHRAEEILLAREAHYPATIADLYDPEKMPRDLSEAHKHNDEVLERIYIGRRFRNDTERLEKLFELYARMTTAPTKVAKETTV